MCAPRDRVTEMCNGSYACDLEVAYRNGSQSKWEGNILSCSPGGQSKLMPFHFWCNYTTVFFFYFGYGTRQTARDVEWRDAVSHSVSLP